MSDFSSLLAQYIEEKKIKIYALSRQCQIDRSTLYRFINGRQRPSSLELVMRLANAMQLSPQQTYLFCEAWKIARTGKILWYQHKATEHFLKYFSSVPSGSDFSQSWDEGSECPSFPDKKMMLLSTREELYAAFRTMLVKESMEPHPDLLLLLQPEHPHLFRILLGDPRCKSFHIDHILCLNNQTPSTPSHKVSGFYNMECLEAVFPIFLHGITYQAWYYYDDVKSHFSPVSLMPCMILTGTAAITCSADLSFGIMHTEVSVISMLHRLFRKHQAQTHPLTFQCSWTDPYYFKQMQSFQGKNTVSFSQEPYIYSWLTAERLQKYYLPEIQQKNDLLSEFSLYLSSWKEYTENTSTVWYCTQSGLERFMATGRIHTIPHGIMRPLSCRDRRLYLKTVESLIQNRKIFILKEPLENLTHHFHLNISVQSVFIVFIDERKQLSGLALYEPSLVNAFFEFFTSKDSADLYSTDESCALVRKMMI